MAKSKTKITTSGGKSYAWEPTDKWPNVPVIFNTNAFNYPEKRYNTDSQAPYQRAAGYPRVITNSVRSRGKPQLTWFYGKYDVWGDVGEKGYPGKCQYPHVLGPYKNGRRKCLVPGKATPAELAAARARQKQREDAMAKEIGKSLALQAAANPKDACTNTAYTSWQTSFKTRPAHISPTATREQSGDKYRWKYVGQYWIVDPASGDRVKAYKVGNEYTSGATYYSCATGKKLSGPIYSVIRGIDGLGATSPKQSAPIITEAEKKKMKEIKTTYRTTEMSLIALLAVSAILVWKK